MKKLAFAAVVLATALTTQAASVAWKSSALSFGSTALKSDTSVTGYLVLLSGSSLASPYTFNETFDASVVGSVVNSDTDGTSKGSLVNGTLANADSHIVTSGNAAGLLALSIAESFGVIRIGDRYHAEIAST